MKRISSEQINQIVKDFLKQRNYSEIKSNRMKPKTCSLKELALNGSLNQNNYNAISLTSSVGDFSLIAENAFKHFLNYVTHSQSESIRQQLSQFNYPFFVFIFIELFECGHKSVARRFFRDHKSKFQDLPETRIIDSINNTLNHQILDPNLKSFKSSKYCVKISKDCFQQMHTFFEQINDLVIIQIMNTYIDINLYSSDNQTEYEKPDRVMSSPSKCSLFDELEFVSPNVKTFQANASNNDKELLLNAIKKVRNSEPCVPSICLYSIKSSNLSCVSVTNDMKFVGGGFENSNIYLWNFASDAYCRSQTKIHVKRQASRIELNIIDHDIDEDQNNGQTLSSDWDLNGLTADQSVKVLRGHSAPVYGLTFLPRSNILLSCSCDTTVRAWDTMSGNNVALFDGHLYPIWSIDSCFLGNYFATGCKDGVCCLWSTERSFPLRTYCGHNMDVDCVKFHPNCTYIATASGDKLIKLWDIQQTRAVRTFNGHQGSVYCLSFSPCGKYLASAGEDRKVKLWDIASGNLLKDFAGHTDAVYSLSFNNYNTILSSCGADQSLKLWNLNKIIANSSKTSLSDSDNCENNLRNSTDSGLLVSYQVELNSLIHTQYMPHNLLLSVGTKTP